MVDMKYIIIFSCILLVLFPAKNSFVKASSGSGAKDSLNLSNDNEPNEDTSMKNVERLLPEVGSYVGDLTNNVAELGGELGKVLDNAAAGLENVIPL